MITGIHSKGDGKIKWISTDFLEDNMGEELMILDAQPDVHDYIKEHIPEAYYFNEWFLREMRRNDPTHYIPQEAIQEIFRKLGIEKDMPTVVYTGKGTYSKRGDGWGQTMTAYSLSRFGHDEVYLLDGGIDKWKEEGKELTNIFPTVEESYFNVEVRDDYFIGYEEFKEIKDNENVVVLDARPPKYFEGESLWSKPGHIPGARNLQAATLMQPHNLQFMKPESEIKRMVEKLGATPDKTIICYCGTGREATNLFLTFKWFLGYNDAKLYEGSFTEWTQRDDNPTETGPGIIRE